MTQMLGVSVKKAKKMKTILIIAGLVVFVILFSRRNRRKVSNPIDTIKFGSCMGFKIGDRKQFVLSRINHLKLMSNEEKEDFDLEEKMGSGAVLSQRMISTSKGIFNNIEGVSFTITNDKLTSIHISLKPEQTDQQTLTNFIEKRIISNNGNTIFNGTWKKGNYIIVLEKKRDVH